jgi:hypothetical protein
MLGARVEVDKTAHARMSGPQKFWRINLPKIVAIVGSREFGNYEQLKREALKVLEEDDEIVSGGAAGADSMANRLALEEGYDFHGYYPKKKKYGIPAAYFVRNKLIAKRADMVLAFYQKGRFALGGTADTAKQAHKLGKVLLEFEEE